MKKAFAWLMLLMAITLFSVAAVPVKADPITQDLYAGSPHYYGEPGPKDPSWYYAHRMRVGWVRVWNDGDNLYVRYTTLDVGMDETHVAVAEAFEDIPQTKSGNPKVGQFPYKHEGLGGAMTDLYTIPLGDWGPGTELVIAAHAALCNGETAWADCGGPDAYFPGNNWATYFTYIVQEIDG